MTAATREICYLSAAEQARRIAAGDLSAREVCDAHLERIAAVDPALGAYLTVDIEGARTQANQVDQARARGAKLGPLAGVPIGIKDVLVTRDLVTTAASRILEGWVPPYDGTAVGKLRAAGAVIVGKLNCDEFAMGSSSERSAFKVCRNPWDPGRVPGGSSGGSAAATAAGLCAAALGTDTGGSIRQPAALCGAVGLKPTYGRVSRYGAIAFASSLDQIGPVARCAEDAALVLQAIAGFDPRDATSIDRPVPDYRAALDRGIEGLRIGLPNEYQSAGVDPEVAAHLDDAAAHLAAAGAEVCPISLPHAEYSVPCYYLIATAEASSNLARYDGVKYGLRRAGGDRGLHGMYCQTRAAGFGPEVKRRIMLGTFALRAGYYDAYYRKAQQVRALIKRDFDRAFESVDLVLSPTSPTPAFPIGERTSDPLAMYLSDIFTLSCNLAGLPGISVPCGLTQGSLPVGMQLVARPLAEETLLAAAAAYENVTDGETPRPPEMTGA